MGPGYTFLVNMKRFLSLEIIRQFISQLLLAIFYSTVRSSKPKMFLVLLCIFVALLIGYFFKTLSERLSSQLPPGPWELPILGYTPFLSASPHKDYIQMQKKYGNVFGFHSGSRYTIILNDYASVKEAFNKDDCVDRPPGTFTFSEEYQHVADMNGPVWKETRRFVLTTLRNLGTGKNKLEERIKEELASDLEKLATLNAREVNLQELFHRLLLNTMFSMICGKTFEDSSSVIAMVEKHSQWLFSLTDAKSKQLYFPYLKPYFAFKTLFKKKHGVEDFKEMENFFWNEIDEHTKNYDENFQEDFFDYFITEMKKTEGQPSGFTRGNMNGNSQVLLLAGTDTTRASLSWIFLCLAKYPEKQDKVCAEILEIFGTEKAPSWSDRESLPYVNSFIMEVARFKTLAPASDPHWSSQDSSVCGFLIPKNSLLIANVFAVHNDEGLWGDPGNFRPERFLSPDGKKVIQPEYWIPFLTGKRSCPGEKIASMQLFLVMTAVVQKFEILPPESGLCLEELDGLMAFPTKPIVSIQLRT